MTKPRFQIVDSTDKTETIRLSEDYLQRLEDSGFPELARYFRVQMEQTRAQAEQLHKDREA